MTNYNLNRFIRRCIYTLKREYGVSIVLYKLLTTNTDRDTGVKTETHTSYPISRAVVLPLKEIPEVIKNISILSANKRFAFGGYFDTGTRMFLIDRKDVKDVEDLTVHDWIIYHDKRYDIKSLEELEDNTSWIVIGNAQEGVVPVQDRLGTINHTLNLTQEAAYVLEQATRYFELVDVLSFTHNATGNTGQELNESGNNTLNLIQNATVISILNKQLSDTLNLTQNVTVSGIFDKQLSETLNLTQNVTVTATFNKQLSDTLNLTQNLTSTTANSLTSNLVSSWHLEETGNATREDSFGTNDLTPFNDPSSVSGKINNALRCVSDTNDQMVYRDALQPLDTDFSFAGWLYLRDVTLARPILTEQGNTNTRYRLFYDQTASRLRWEVQSNTPTVTTVNANAFGALSVNTWYFFTVYNDSVNDQIGISVNNGTVNTAAHGNGASRDPGDGVFRLGAGTINNAGSNVDLDAIHYFSKVLSSADITALYNSGTGIEL